MTDQFVYGLILILSIQSVCALYDNNTWIDYETLRLKNLKENVTENVRSTIWMEYNSYNYELLVNRSKQSNGDKIVGGTKAKIKDFPYQISIQEKNFGHFCGGSLITLKWILTAAHCFYGSSTPIANYYIRAGSSFHASGGAIAFPKKIYVANKFSSSTNDYDIAMIKLKNGFSKKLVKKFSIRRIFIRNRLPGAGTFLTVTGWGTTSSGSVSLPAQLRKVKVPLLKNSYCNTQTLNAGSVTARMFCAGLLRGTRDSCQGDSGGPIVVNKKLVGIVSWGIGCAFANAPGVYTRVPVFISYIKALIASG